MRRVRSFRSVLGAAALTLAGAGSSAAVADPVDIPAPIDPLDLYGNEIKFDILRDGEPVGDYLVRFKRSGAELQVESRASIDVELFFISAYRLRYQSLETWRDGMLSSLSAATNDDGEFSQVRAVREGAALSVSGVEGQWQAEPTVLPTTHWNMAQIAAPVLINTISGEPIQVSVIEAGIENVPVGGDVLPARRFLYTGDLDVEAWYDNAGRWVKLRFAAQDGSTIEYRCQRCSGPTSLTEAE